MELHLTFAHPIKPVNFVLLCSQYTITRTPQVTKRSSTSQATCAILGNYEAWIMPMAWDTIKYDKNMRTRQNFETLWIR